MTHLNADPIWKAFAESGDPLYYLLYKAINPDEKKNEENGSVT